MARFENDPQILAVQVRLRDKLGDNGMISVIICRAEPDVLEIDTWLMSCRVLGRGVELAVLREVLDHAKLRNARRLRGLYVPTDRNKLVEQHYAKLGFTSVGMRDDGATVWELDVASASLEPPPMVVRGSRFEWASSKVAQ